MRLPTQKILAGALASLLLFEAVGLPLVEASVWEERQAQRSKKPEKAPQFAGLPASSSFPTILPALPSLSKALNQTPSVALPAHVTPLIGAISLQAGTIKDIHLDSQKGPFAVLIQDVHMNEEAQKNIAEILMSVQSVKPLTVGLEGLFGQTTYDRFQAFEDKKLLRTLGDYFLKDNKISASAYSAALADNPKSTFVGVDDEVHYQSNVEAYRATQQKVKSILAQLEEDRRRLSRKKVDGLNAALSKFDLVRTQYEKGTLGLGDYISFLAKDEAERDLVIEQFLMAYQIEKSLNFTAVEHERTRVLEKLVGTLNGVEMKGLVDYSMAYRTGRIGFGTFYQEIKKKIQNHGISLSETPAFDKYIQYVMLVEGLSGEKLLKAVASLERQLLARLATTPSEKQIMAESRHLGLTEKLVEFSLTPEEWAEYKNSGIKNETFRNFERFYREADIRSEKMVDNLLREAKSQTSMVLIAGGFHTPYLSALLKKRGVSFAVVQPKITKLDGSTGTEYLSVFTQQKTRLDELFEGEKLFLMPDMRSGTALFQQAADVYSQMAGANVQANLLPTRAQRNDDGTFSVPLSRGAVLRVGVEGKSNINGLRVAPGGTLPVTVWGRARQSLFTRIKKVVEKISDFIDRIQWPVRVQVLVTPDGQQIRDWEWVGLLSAPLYSITTNPAGGGGSSDQVEVSLPGIQGNPKMMVSPVTAKILANLFSTSDDSRPEALMKQLLGQNKTVLELGDDFALHKNKGLVVWGIQNFDRLDPREQETFRKIAYRAITGLFMVNEISEGLLDEVGARFLTLTDLRQLTQYLLLWLISQNNGKNSELIDMLIAAFINDLDYRDIRENVISGSEHYLRDQVIAMRGLDKRFIAEVVRLTGSEVWFEYGHSEKLIPLVREYDSLERAAEKDAAVPTQPLPDLAQAMEEIKNIVGPGNPDNLEAWNNPVAYTVSRILQRGNVNVFFHLANFSYASLQGLPNSLRFQLHWLETMGANGYKQVVFTNNHHIAPLSQWLAESGRSVDDTRLVDDINNFVNDDKTTLSLFQYLGLPSDVPMIPAVLSVMEFWQSVRAIRQRTGMEILMFRNIQGGDFSPAEKKRHEIFENWRAGKNQKRILFGDFRQAEKSKQSVLLYQSTTQVGPIIEFGVRPFVIAAAASLLSARETVGGNVAVRGVSNGKLRDYYRSFGGRISALYEKTIYDPRTLAFIISEDYSTPDPTRNMRALTLPGTRDRAIEKMVRWGWVAQDANPNQKFSRPIELVIGLYASVVEVFHVFNPFGFYRAHDNPRWYQALGILAIWAGMVFVGYISFDLFTFDSNSLSYRLDALLPSFILSLLGNMVVHALYNFVAVVFGYSPLSTTMRLASMNSDQVGILSEKATYRSEGEKNEDSAFAETLPNGVFIAGVFDGMGGMEAGERASRAVRYFVEKEFKTFLGKLGNHDQHSDSEIGNYLGNILWRAKKQLDRELSDVPGSGTTATVSVLFPLPDGGYRGFVVNSADSRAYYSLGGNLVPLTIDNTVPELGQDKVVFDIHEVAYRYQAGWQGKLADLTDLNSQNTETSNQFANRFFVNGSLSVGGDDYRPVVTVFRLPPGAKLLLTSDGVHDPLTDDLIGQVLGQNKTPTDIAKELVAQARSQSGLRRKDDDKTAVVFQSPQSQQHPSPEIPSGRVVTSEKSSLPQNLRVNSLGLAQVTVENLESARITRFGYRDNSSPFQMAVRSDLEGRLFSMSIDRVDGQVYTPVKIIGDGANTVPGLVDSWMMSLEGIDSLDFDFHPKGNIVLVMKRADGSQRRYRINFDEQKNRVGLQIAPLDPVIQLMEPLKNRFPFADMPTVARNLRLFQSPLFASAYFRAVKADGSDDVTFLGWANSEGEILGFGREEDAPGEWLAEMEKGNVVSFALRVNLNSGVEKSIQWGPVFPRITLVGQPIENAFQMFNQSVKKKTETIEKISSDNTPLFISNIQKFLSPKVLALLSQNWPNGVSGSVSALATELGEIVWIDGLGEAKDRKTMMELRNQNSFWFSATIVQNSEGIYTFQLDFMGNPNESAKQNVSLAADWVTYIQGLAKQDTRVAEEVAPVPADNASAANRLPFKINYNNQDMVGPVTLTINEVEMELYKEEGEVYLRLLSDPKNRVDRFNSNPKKVSTGLRIGSADANRISLVGIADIHMELRFDKPSGTLIIVDFHPEDTRIETQKGQHASKFGWWMQAITFWAMFGVAVWLANVNFYYPSGRWWGIFGILSFVLAGGATYIASVLPRGFLARTYNGEDPYFNTEVMYALPLHLRYLVVAEEAWHQWTTKRLQQIMDLPYIGFLVRNFDEFGAKSFAIIYSFILGNRIVFVGRYPPFDYDAPRFKEKTEPSNDTELVAVSRNGNVRAELIGEIIRVVWVRGGELILEIDVSGFGKITKMELQNRGGLIFLEDETGHKNFTNLNIARQTGLKKINPTQIVGPSYITIKGYQLYFTPGNTTVRLTDTDQGGQSEIDLSRGLFSRDGLILALYGRKLAYVLNEKVEVFDPEAVTQSKKRLVRNVSSVHDIWFSENGQRLIINTRDEGFTWDLDSGDISPIGRQDIPDEVPQPTTESDVVIPYPVAIKPVPSSGKPVRKPFDRRGGDKNAGEILELANGGPKPIERQPVRTILPTSRLGLAFGISGNSIEWAKNADKTLVVGRYDVDEMVSALAVHPNQPILIIATQNRELIYLNIENPEAPFVSQKKPIGVVAIQISFPRGSDIMVSYFDETGKLKHQKIFGPGPQYGFAPLLGMPLWESVGSIWTWVGLGGVAVLIGLMVKYGKPLRIYLSVLRYKLTYGRLTISEQRILNQIQRNTFWKADELLPIRQYNLNDRTIDRIELEMFQRTVVNETRDPLDMALYAMLREQTSPVNFDLDPNSSWPSNGDRIHLRIRMADPESLTIDTEDILKDLGRNDVAVVYANEQAQFTKPDSRIVRLTYSGQDVSAERIKHALSIRSVNIKNIDMAEVRASKMVMKHKGIVRFLQDLSRLIGPERLDVFLLLPLNEKINALIPVDVMSLERLVDFENLIRRIIQTQA